jgi:hypothetical protein
MGPAPLHLRLSVKAHASSILPVSSLPGAQQPPTVTEAALVLMSAWRTKRYLLAIVGDEITPNDLGSRTSAVSNLHLKGITIRVGGDVDAPGFEALGEATKLSGWDTEEVLSAFGRMNRVIDGS